MFDLIRKEGVGGSRAEWVMYSVCCRRKRQWWASLQEMEGEGSQTPQHC